MGRQAKIRAARRLRNAENRRRQRLGQSLLADPAPKLNPAPFPANRRRRLGILAERRSKERHEWRASLRTKKAEH
jgi:hypothetical protein